MSDTFLLPEPRPDKGIYTNLYIPNLAGDRQIYIQGGYYKNGVPYVWKLVLASIGITTDGTVVNRTPYINVQDESWQGLGGVRGKEIGANSAGSTDLMQIAYMDSNVGGANQGLVGLTPEGLILQGKSRLDIFWINGCPGDRWYINCLFKDDMRI